MSQDLPENNGVDRFRLIQSETDEMVITGFNPFEALERVGEVINKLQAEIKRLKQEYIAEVTDLKIECRRLEERSVRAEQEAEKLKSAKADLESKLQVCSSWLDEERDVTSQQKVRVANLSNEVAELKEKRSDLHDRLNLTLEKVTKMEEDMEKLLQQNTSLEARLEQAESALNVETSKVAAGKKEAKRLQAELRATDDKIKILDQKQELIQKKLEDEKKKHSQRIAAEKESELRHFRNRIGNNLAFDYRKIEKLNLLPMSVKVGEEMRTQVNAVFSKLRELGIDLTKLD